MSNSIGNKNMYQPFQKGVDLASTAHKPTSCDTVTRNCYRLIWQYLINTRSRWEIVKSAWIWYWVPLGLQAPLQLALDSYKYNFTQYKLVQWQLFKGGFIKRDSCWETRWQIACNSLEVRDKRENYEGSKPLCLIRVYFTWHQWQQHLFCLHPVQN